MSQRNRVAIRLAKQSLTLYRPLGKEGQRIYYSDFEALKSKFPKSQIVSSDFLVKSKILDSTVPPGSGEAREALDMGYDLIRFPLNGLEAYMVLNFKTVMNQNFAA